LKKLKQRNQYKVPQNTRNEQKLPKDKQQYQQKLIHVINFVKLSLLANRLREFQSTQQTPYSFSPLATVAHFFENELVHSTPEQLFLVSKQVEPASIVREYKRNQQILAQEDASTVVINSSSYPKAELRGTDSATDVEPSLSPVELEHYSKNPTEDQERAKKETKKLEKELRKFEREFEVGTAQFLRGSIQYNSSFANVNTSVLLGGTLKRQKLRRVLTMQPVNTSSQHNQ